MLLGWPWVEVKHALIFRKRYGTGRIPNKKPALSYALGLAAGQRGGRGRDAGRPSDSEAGLAGQARPMVAGA